MNKKQIVLISFVVLLLIAFFNINAIAATDLPWEDPLETFKDSLTGKVAFFICLIAIMITGGMLIFGGELSDFGKRMIYLILVIAVLGLAANFLEGLFPDISGSGALISSYLSSSVGVTT